MAVNDGEERGREMKGGGAEPGWYAESWLLKPRQRQDQNKWANKTPKQEHVGEPGRNGPGDQAPVANRKQMLPEDASLL